MAGPVALASLRPGDPRGPWPSDRLRSGNPAGPWSSDRLRPGNPLGASSRPCHTSPGSGPLRGYSRRPSGPRDQGLACRAGMTVSPIALTLAVIGLAGGMVLFGRGLVAYRRDRLITAVATSSLDGLAAGEVRVSGVVEALDQQLTSPLQSRPCVWYRARIETTGDNSRVLFAEERAVHFRVADGRGTGTFASSLPVPAGRSGSRSMAPPASWATNRQASTADAEPGTTRRLPETPDLTTEAQRAGRHRGSPDGHPAAARRPGRGRPVRHEPAGHRDRTVQGVAIGRRGSRSARRSPCWGTRFPGATSNSCSSRTRPTTTSSRPSRTTSPRRAPRRCWHPPPRRPGATPPSRASASVVRPVPLSSTPRPTCPTSRTGRGSRGHGALRDPRRGARRGPLVRWRAGHLRWTPAAAVQRHDLAFVLGLVGAVMAVVSALGLGAAVTGTL